MDKFKLIIAGGRDFNDFVFLANEVLLLGEIPEIADKEVHIVCGMAPGADLLGKRFGKDYNLPVHEFPAMWKRRDGSVDKGAGYVRNIHMANFANGLIAFWDGKSKGTKHMIDSMRKQGKFVKIVNY